MENLAGLITVLLEHSQRFTDFWNFHIIVALGVLGFTLSNEQVASKLRVRILLSFVFILIAIYSTFSLSVHQQREVNLWNALESRITEAPNNYTSQEIRYIDSLKPTDFGIKVGALLTADLLVVLVIWFSAKIKE